MSLYAAQFAADGVVPQRQGSGQTAIVPYRAYRTRDGDLVVAAANNSLFQRLSQVLGHPEWASDERFSTNAARVGNRAEMVRLVGECIRRKPADEWFSELEVAGIPAGPINTISQALADIQTQHRQTVRTIAGMPLVGSPVRIDGERADSELPPPALGEHTSEVLESLSVDGEEQARLRTSGVIG